VNVVICNTPLRDEDSKTVYPPLGSMAIVQALHDAGYEDTAFYDINYFRPTQDDIAAYLRKGQFDVVGISATTSSTYKDTKALAHLAKSVLPDCAVVVGGALAFSAEILLRLGGADFTVLGEGEKVAVNLVRHLEAHGLHQERDALRDIKGLSFLDERNDVAFTGYEKALQPAEIPYPDYTILTKYSVIGQYIHDPKVYEQFKHDPRTDEPKRRGKLLATVVASRGCISRCTFCHRWQQGIRMFKVDTVIEHIKFLMEDFGATKAWIAELAEKIAPLDILYRVSAIRVDNITGDLLKQLQASGCIASHYGWESGSDRMLRVMEKMATVEQNVQAAMWTKEAGLQTVPALVVGMPGESYETIQETTDFLCKITEHYPYAPILSVNQLVALPATPVYEYARKRGFMGTTLEDEEQYLLIINDKGGESALNLNLTDYPFFVVQGWIRSIYWAVNYHYCKHNKIPTLSTWKLPGRIFDILVLRKSPSKFSEGLFSHPIFYHLRHIIAPSYVAVTTWREVGPRLFFSRVWEFITWPFRRAYYKECLPLREYLKEHIQTTLALGKTNPEVLRLGR
jgi:anaerobic magnesium-protoporphyrin IX monomethyl ester cyclase